MVDRIFGIGTDIVRVPRMKAIFDRYGERVAMHLLTPKELDEFTALRFSPARFLAKRFAAKEAVAKALGLGFSQGLRPKSIGIDHKQNGKPVLEYYERALELVRAMGITEGHISIADEEEHVIAFVTLLSK